MHGPRLRLRLLQLHTLEDFSAHSNFCELVLVSMGHGEVFTHVGDQVRVQAANGRWVAPLVTGELTLAFRFVRFAWSRGGMYEWELAADVCVACRNVWV